MTIEKKYYVVNLAGISNEYTKYITYSYGFELSLCNLSFSFNYKWRLLNVQFARYYDLIKLCCSQQDHKQIPHPLSHTKNISIYDWRKMQWRIVRRLSVNYHISSYYIQYGYNICYKLCIIIASEPAFWCNTMAIWSSLRTLPFAVILLSSNHRFGSCLSP